MKRVLLVAMIASVAVFTNGCAIVSTGEVGVKTSLGTVKSDPLQPGMHIAMPIVDWVTTLSTRTVSVPEEFTSITSDGQTMKVTATAQYVINAEKAPQIFTSIGSDDKSVQDKVLQPVLLGSVKNVISRYKIFDIIENQNRISQEVEALIKKSLEQNGYVSFQSFVVTGFVLDPEVQKSIEQKQIAQQRLAQKNTEVEIAKKEAERLQALQGAITPSTLMKEAIEKWDGSGIPPTAGGNMNLLIQSAPKK